MQLVRICSLVLLVPWLAWADITSNLLGHYALEESSSPSDDQGSANLNGTWSGTPSVTDGKIGNGLHFPGASWVDIGDVSPYDSTFTAVTVAFWIRLSAAPSGQSILGKSSGVTTERGWQCSFISASDFLECFYWDIASGGTVHQLDIGTTLTLDTWTHIALVFAANTKEELYLNGTLVDSLYSGVLATINMANNASLRLGDRGTNATPLVGDLDDVRIYNRALTESDVDELVALGNPSVRKRVILTLARPWDLMTALARRLPW